MEVASYGISQASVVDVIHIVCLLIVVFLIALNGFLNGALKTRIDAVLGVVLLCVLGAQFYWFSWNGLFEGVAVAIIAVGFFQPLARRLAAFMLAPAAKDLKLFQSKRPLS